MLVKLKISFERFSVEEKLFIRTRQSSSFKESLFFKNLLTFNVALSSVTLKYIHSRLLPFAAKFISGKCQPGTHFDHVFVIKFKGAEIIK